MEMNLFQKGCDISEYPTMPYMDKEYAVAKIWETVVESPLFNWTTPIDILSFERSGVIRNTVIMLSDWLTTIPPLTLSQHNSHSSLQFAFHYYYPAQRPP